MNIQDEEKPYDDLNITPMLDLAYVLLVIFILLTTASVQGAKVDLPKANATASLAQPKTQVIAVKANGEFALSDVIVSVAELKSRLQAAALANPKVPVIIKGDRAVQYDKIVTALDICNQVGLSSVGLASSRAN